MQSKPTPSLPTTSHHNLSSTPLTRSTSLGKATVVTAPHSRRVVKEPNISTATDLSNFSSSPSSPSVVPPRSPHRPSSRLRSRSTPQRPKQTSRTSYTTLNTRVTERPMAHTYSALLPSDVSTDPYFSPSTISYSASEVSTDPSAIVLSAADILSPTSIAFRSDSPESMNNPEERLGSQVRRGTSSLSIVNMLNASFPSLSKPCQAPPPAMTKRLYALHELLSSERAYASDLALIRDIHLPLALGLSVPLSNIPATPPNSSGSSSRTQSTSSDSSSASLGSPMTPEDAKIIFGNITEIAIFTDMFTEELELALGSVVEGGQGTDTVGALFLRIALDLERPYKYYITRHPTAMQHLQNLPQTPALQNYLTYTQAVSSSLSHAWDLASLLIKPVQRLLKYPLLLTAIIDETPDDHPDKENLRVARATIEEVARNVNEGRRRAEVVKDVLTSKSTKKPNTSVGVTASVSLSKMMSIRHGGVTAATMRVSQLEGSNNEALRVEVLQAELRRIDLFAKEFAKTIVDWGKMTSNMMFALRTWSHSFGTVIGLSVGQGSEAFDAFLDVVEKGLLPLTSDLEATINDRILKDLAHLLMTMNQPFKLIASMNEQEPYHYHLLTMPLNAKNRPPPSLLAASSNYLALRGQLVADLPTYIHLLHKGLATLIRRLAEIQTIFWADVRDRWVGLWEMLRAETELNVGWKETCEVWLTRWAEVDQLLNVLIIATPVQDVVAKFLMEKEEREKKHRQNEQEAKDRQERELALRERDMEKVLRGQIGPPSPGFKNSGRSYPRATPPSSASAKVATVNSAFASLEPTHVKKAKARKVTPVVVIDRSDAFSLSNPGSSSPVSSNRVAASSTATLVSADGTEVGRRGRAFSADSASILNGGIPTPPSSRDGAPPQKATIRGPFRRKPDDSHPRPHTSTQDFDGHYLKSSQSRTSVGMAQAHRPQLTRMQSMPLSVRGADRRPISPISDDDDNDDGKYYENCFADRFTHSYHGPSQPQLSVPAVPSISKDVQRPTSAKQQRDTGSGHSNDAVTALTKHRSRSSARGEAASTRDASPRNKTKETDREKEKDRDRESKDRPVQGRKRSGSVKSITSFFTGNNGNSSRSDSPPPLTPSQRDSWVAKPAKYICQVVHPCKPPATVSYYSFPFFTLLKGDFHEVLQEAGHPSIHPKLPLYVDDGEDCLLLCRNREGLVGWALASFLEPVTMVSP